MKILTVKFLTDDNKIVDYENSSDLFQKGDYLIISNGQIDEIAKIINISDKLCNEKGVGVIEKKLSDDDFEKLKKIKQKAQKFIALSQEKVLEYQLSMKILDADLSFDEKKLTLYFCASKRVDFRKLVSDLVKMHKKLIRLQQIGPREQAKKLCGVGRCNQELCCCRFLTKIDSVTLESAKNQNMGEVNVNKINGLCGKLMCCLNYEEKIYLELKKKMPNVGEKIKTEQGIGEIIKQNVLTNSVTARLEDNQRIEVQL